MQSPFFSVIIPTYNRAKFLSKPIESVIRQTFQSWELIIIDDGSTDETGQVVKSYSDKDPRIKYISQTNQERSAARNTGIQNSQGQYICFLDSDDYYLPQHLTSFHRKITEENYPVALLYCDTLEDSDGKLTQFITPVIEACNPVEWVVQMSLGSPRTCLHRNILEKYKFNPALTVGEDVELWVRILKEFSVIHHADYSVVFVSHKDRTVAIGNEKSVKAHLSLVKRIFSEDKTGFISKNVRKKVLSSAWFRIGQHYVYAGKNGHAFFSFLRSLLIAPRLRGKEKVYLMLQQINFMRKLIAHRANLRQQTTF